MDRVIHPHRILGASCGRCWESRLVPAAHRVTASTTTFLYKRDDGPTAVDGG